MADRGDTHYHVTTLNRWFAFSSVVLLVAAAWMVIDDWNAPWKKYQREFRSLEVERARAALESDTAQAVEARTEELEAEVERQRESLASRRSEVEAMKEELRLLRGVQFAATEEAKRIKQEYNWERYLIEEHRQHDHDPDYKAEELADLERRLNEAELAQEVADQAILAKEAEYAELQVGVTEAELEVKLANKEMDLVRTKLDSLAPEDPAAQLANIVRDFPGLDFVEPNLKVRKVVLENLTFELNFTKKPRIDMCMTCHMASDRAGFTEEDLEEPHRSHPRLDLYLTAKSPHPLSEVGCTICHRGSGEALHFTRADHRPSNEEEEAEWQEEYHWHKQHHWDYPMLDSGRVEASCVQCHKTSMELIADDAPEVTEGYRLFERYGCYSCHKVDWFPTKRRPGPSLKNLQSKIDSDFLDSWIAKPRDFRPTTWMPQIFHLENFAAEEPVVESNYGQGRPILGGEWNESAVAAISAFVTDRAPLKELEPMPLEGDSLRGRELFRVSGCLACHNVAPYEGADDLDPYLEWVDAGGEEIPVGPDFAQLRNETNEHGPNLRGVATKVNPTWLYHWIKNPAEYWSETRMPDLRLSDQEAADIVAYVFEDPDGYFNEVPEGWDPEASPYDMEVLAEMARWYFSRETRETIATRLEGGDPRYRWDRPEDLLVDVGEKLVQNYGCYSCHEIDGMEDAMPIGVELTNWGSKTVDKLDWGFLANLMAEEEGWDFHKREEFKVYRENWIVQKLHEPRSYDRGKVKNPTERLKMPWFDFEDEEVHALSTFVVGLVDDEVQRARMIPDVAEAQMDAGLRVLRQKNCAACHVIEPGELTYHDGDHTRTIAAELLPVDDYADTFLHPTPPQDSLEALEAYLAHYEDGLGTEVEDVGWRLLRPEPEVGEPGKSVYIDREDLVAVKPAWGGDFVRALVNYYTFGYTGFDPEYDDYFFVTGDPDGEGRVMDVDGEYRPLYEEQYDKLRWTYAPPVLYDEGGKLQKDWFYAFLQDPEPLRPQVRVRMPSFTWAAGEAGAVADYFARASERDWPVTYARELRLAQGSSIEALAEAAELSPADLEGIENGSRPSIDARFAKLFQYGEAIGFETWPPVDPDYEHIQARTPSYLAAVEAAHERYLPMAERLAVEGPECFQCHFRNGEPPNADPIAWAPDLALTRERLREAWTSKWLTNPNRVYPGTAMPGNFLSEDPQYQDLFPDSTNAQQIRAVVDWLYNFERVSVRN